MRKVCITHVVLLAVFLSVIALMIQGCGGGDGTVSTVSGTVADINRNVIVGATVSSGNHQTKSLITGTYRLNNVSSGWQTLRARATINGELWVGSTAAEVLRDEPTFNVNIVLTPEADTTTIRGVVRDTSGRAVRDARVLLTTRIVFGDNTSAFDGPFSSIVAVTDGNGRYTMDDVPVVQNATIAASKVGFVNDEEEIDVTRSDMTINFTLTRSDLEFSQLPPELQAIESYTMPDEITVRTKSDAYKAIKAFTSERYRKALAQQKPAVTRVTPEGSLIEVDLYWNGLDVNDSREVAGYGIYRTTTGQEQDLRSIDFVRDPYANFYGDTGIELTPGTNYTYAVTSVDVEFLDLNNEPDPAAESDLSNLLSVRPLGQLRANSPADDASVLGDPVFTWQALTRAVSYTVYVYSRFPSIPLDPSFDYGTDPIVDSGVFPIWPTSNNLDDSTTTGTSIAFNGPVLTTGHRYFWVVLAQDSTGTAFSYSELRSFVAR